MGERGEMFVAMTMACSQKALMVDLVPLFTILKPCPIALVYLFERWRSISLPLVSSLPRWLQQLQLGTRNSIQASPKSAGSHHPLSPRMQDRKQKGTQPQGPPIWDAGIPNSPFMVAPHLCFGKVVSSWSNYCSKLTHHVKNSMNV